MDIFNMYGILKYTAKRLIKIYTPFICALIAIIHGVLYFCKYKGTIWYLFNDVTGHSILLVLYVLSTSKNMCVWYKATCWFLILMHVPNILYTYKFFTIDTVMYLTIIIGLFALLSFLIYRVSVGITKILC